jgi:adenylate kinase family enzyme
MGSPRYMNESWLRDQYVVQEREISDIALDCKVDKSTIIKWLDEYRIYRNWRRL